MTVEMMEDAALFELEAGSDPADGHNNDVADLQTLRKMGMVVIGVCLLTLALVSAALLLS